MNGSMFWDRTVTSSRNTFACIRIKGYYVPPIRGRHVKARRAYWQLAAHPDGIPYTFVVTGSRTSGSEVDWIGGRGRRKFDVSAIEVDKPFQFYIHPKGHSEAWRRFAKWLKSILYLYCGTERLSLFSPSSFIVVTDEERDSGWHVPTRGGKSGVVVA